MFETTAGQTFLTALHKALRRHLGADHPCAVAADDAVRGGDPAAVAAVQEALGALPEATIERVMADVHKTLRESPAAVLGQWRGAAPRQ